MVTSYLPSPVRPDGVLKRHPDTLASQSIPRTPAQVVPPCSGVIANPEETTKDFTFVYEL